MSEFYETINMMREKANEAERAIAAGHPEMAREKLRAAGVVLLAMYPCDTSARAEAERAEAAKE